MSIVEEAQEIIRQSDNVSDRNIQVDSDEIWNINREDRWFDDYVTYLQEDFKHRFDFSDTARTGKPTVTKDENTVTYTFTAYEKPNQVQDDDMITADVHVASEETKPTTFSVKFDSSNGDILEKIFENDKNKSITKIDPITGKTSAATFIKYDPKTREVVDTKTIKYD